MKFSTLVCTSLLIACGAANAAIVSVGALTSNTNESSIVDSQNGREWLRWDVLKGITYAQTLGLIAPGGSFDGWKIARNADAILFLNALVGPNNCAPVTFDVCINPVSDDVRLLTGDSFTPNIVGGPYNDFDDYVHFLSDNGVGYGAGVIETIKFPGASTSSVFFKHEQWQIEDADRLGARPGEEMGWLLYRNTPINVPEPTSLALVLLGFLLTWITRRRVYGKN